MGPFFSEFSHGVGVFLVRSAISIRETEQYVHLRDLFRQCSFRARFQLRRERSQDLVAGVQAPAHRGTGRDGFLDKHPAPIQKMHVLHEGRGGL